MIREFREGNRAILQGASGTLLLAGPLLVKLLTLISLDKEGGQGGSAVLVTSANCPGGPAKLHSTNTSALVGVDTWEDSGSCHRRPPLEALEIIYNSRPNSTPPTHFAKSIESQSQMQMKNNVVGLHHLGSTGSKAG
ncbi:hypothetical protein MHYP_G00185750 [Metynnis hypsauchen]